MGEPEQTEASDEDIGDVIQKRVTRATPAVKDGDSDSTEEHYVQFEDPESFMGTRNEDRGEVSTASEDSDIQFSVPQGAQEEPAVEEHTSPEVARSSSEIPSQPLRRSARPGIYARQSAIAMEPSVVSPDSFCSWVEGRIGCPVKQVSRKETGDLQPAIEGCKSQLLNVNCALSWTTIFK